MRNCSVVSKLSMRLSETGEFLLLLPLAAPVALGRSYARCAQCNHAFLWQHASWSSFSRGREAWIGPFLRYVFTDSRPCTGFMVHRNSPRRLSRLENHRFQENEARFVPSNKHRIALKDKAASLKMLVSAGERMNIDMGFYGNASTYLSNRRYIPRPTNHSAVNHRCEVAITGGRPCRVTRHRACFVLGCTNRFC